MQCCQCLMSELMPEWAARDASVRETGSGLDGMRDNVYVVTHDTYTSPRGWN